jgi:hypothetical protein
VTVGLATCRPLIAQSTVGSGRRWRRAPLAHRRVPLSHLSLSRGALGFGDTDRRIWIPVVSSPPLSLPFLFFLLSPTPRASLAAAPARLPGHASCPLGRAPARLPGRRPRGPPCPPPSCASLAVPRAPAPPSPAAVHPSRRALGYVRPATRAALVKKQHLNFSMISFKFNLMNVLRRGTNEFNFKNLLVWCVARFVARRFI